MKKNSFVKFIFVFALWLTFSQSAFAAAPDAEVEGLWLTCPSFPQDAEVLEFNNDTDMDMVTYIRGLDGLLTFEIRRQLIEESELREPGDVKGLIEMRVNNDEIDEEVKNENLESIDVTENVEEAAKIYSYPCTTAEYTTGANEDTTRHLALFIFTDVYCFEVNVSAGADSAENYGERLPEWFTGLKFVESGSGQ